MFFVCRGVFTACTFHFDIGSLVVGNQSTFVFKHFFAFVVVVRFERPVTFQVRGDFFTVVTFHGFYYFGIAQCLVPNLYIVDDTGKSGIVNARTTDVDVCSFNVSSSTVIIVVIVF